MNKFARIVRSPKVVLGTALVTVGGHALAAVPENVSTALTNLQADALTVAGIVLAAIVAVYAFKFIRKGL